MLSGTNASDVREEQEEEVLAVDVEDLTQSRQPSSNVPR
jgi:hypothetical protein